MWHFISGLIFLQLETLSEQKIKATDCAARVLYDSAEVYIRRNNKPIETYAVEIELMTKTKLS